MADFDFDVDDFNFDSIREPSPQPNKRKQDQAGLGIDEEVLVAKRPRAPTVKLDVAKLLSDKGIPRLRQRAGNLKFKGKGHEFSDASKLLEFYQDWLDDLFPKAKFLDALVMVEKLGHKKLIQKQRMEWINEGKPNDIEDVFDGAPPLDKTQVPAKTGRQPDSTSKQPAKLAPMFEKNRGTRLNTPDVDNDLFGDDVVVTDLTPRVQKATLDERPVPMMSGAAFGGQTGSIFGPPGPSNSNVDVNKGGVDDDMDEDDLDALMAEAEAESMLKAAQQIQQTQQTQPATSLPIHHEREFADEEAAMAEMDGLR